MYLKKFLIGIMVASTGLSFVACSNDDDADDDAPAAGPSQNITEVFPNGQISSITRWTEWGGEDPFIWNIKRDKQGRVISMMYYDTPYEISYPSSNTVKVTTYDYEDSDVPRPWVRTMKLGKNGFISSFELQDGSEIFRMNLEYDSEGRMITRKDHYQDEYGSGNSTTTLTYNAAGDIIKVEMQADGVEEGDAFTESYVATADYTNSSVTTAIENKGGIMFFDEFFDIDFDEDICLYYAGLLGKAPAHLPLLIKKRYESNYGSGGENYSYNDTLNLTWTLNGNGLASSLTWVDDDGYQSFYHFSW